MKLTQNWVGALDRGYEQIKASLIKRLTVKTPEITDHTESNPLIIILSMFAGIGEMLNLYIDSISREAYLGSARRYSSAVKLTKLIDYNIRAKNYATVDLLLYLTDINGNPIVAPSDIVIPAGTVFLQPGSTVPFQLIQDTTIRAGLQNVYGKVSQYVSLINDVLGTTDGTQNQKIIISDNYVDGSMSLVIDGQPYALYRSFGLMTSTTKGFIVNIDEFKNAFVELGDGINGLLPTTGKTIFGTYKITEGSPGNVPPNSITSVSSTLTLPSGITLNVNNPDYAIGGTDFEGLDDIKNRAPRSIRTLERGVTYQDYVDLCLMVLGVGAAEVRYCCGKFIDVYIAPSTSGVATQTLLQNVRDYLAPRKMITTQIDVKPAGITKIFIKANIYGKPLAVSSDIYNQVVSALDLEYGYPKLQINRKTSVSDYISTVEQLSTVDRIEIVQVRVLPFVRPVENTTNILSLTFPSLPVGTNKTKYEIIYRSAGSVFEIYEGGIQMDIKTVTQTYADANVQFTINAGTYADGDKWEFYAFPSYPEIFPATLMNIDDFSAPIIEVGPILDLTTPRTIFGDLTIIPQSTPLNTMPPC